MSAEDVAEAENGAGIVIVRAGTYLDAVAAEPQRNAGIGREQGHVMLPRQLTQAGYAIGSRQKARNIAGLARRGYAESEIRYGRCGRNQVKTDGGIWHGRSRNFNQRRGAIATGRLDRILRIC